MKKRWLLSIILLFLATPVGAETFSCRDNQGQLHVADNLMKLPAECLDKAQKIDQKEPSKVNYVSPPAKSSASNPEFAAELYQQQRTIKQQKIAGQQLMTQAKDLADRYRAALIKRKSALRHKKQGFRALVQQAEEQMRSARQEKISLLEKLKSARISQEEQQQAVALLEQIEQ